jgi:transcriptional antiterminator RfaH
MEYWYALQAKPHKEVQVAHQLRQQRIEVCLPLVRAQRVNPRAAALRPYFPTYLFARLDLKAGRAHTVQWLPGLRRLVEFGGQPAVVPDEFIAEIERRLSEMRTVEASLVAGFKPGDRVRIVRGPLAGCEAIFDTRLGGADRVRVLLQWIARQQGRPSDSRPIRVELEAGSLQKVDARRS